MSNYAPQYQQIFEYLRAEQRPEHRAGAVVFGRKDERVGSALVRLARDNMASWAVITGGTGKDSGDLKIPEAEYLAQTIQIEADNKNVFLPPLFIETQATNGGENARNSLTVIRRGLLSVAAGITTVAHATSSVRLRETLRHTLEKEGSPVTVYNVSSDYPFDPSNPADQQEATAEMLRMADWPAKDWLLPQPDVPQNLVDFARDVHGKS